MFSGIGCSSGLTRESNALKRVFIFFDRIPRSSAGNADKTVGTAVG